MAQWHSETGILRKNRPKQNHEELLVFGYACKLFRDDEKAQYIDQGKHLIPWMGDEKLKIDRYDCRGALSDLARFEASREGFDAMRWLGLSENERKLEELCDKERYYSLLINEEEEEMYKEEEQKRLKTNAVQYSYDVPMEPKPQEEVQATVVQEEEPEEEYVPIPALDVPVDINIPKTMKQYAKIEKTAKFVNQHGPQMEILIKAKQGDNPQFSFLNQGDELYKFYRHVLSAFKSGRFLGQIDKNDEKEEEKEEAGDHYLHPSLLASNQQPDTIRPLVPYKPSANCAYSQLVNRIQGGNPPPEPDKQKAQDQPQMTYEQQQYYQYYYTAQYYEYYKQLAQYQQNCGDNPGQIMPPPDFQLDPNTQAYFQQIAYTQYMQHQQQQQQQQQQQNSNSYAQIVSNVSKDSNPYTANVPALPQHLIKPEPEPEPKPKIVQEVKKPPLLSLAQYGSDSEEDEEEEDQAAANKTNDIVVPTGETKIVIDKMAVYVSKNGEQFEDIVKAKGDPRFEFLNPTHEHFNYYKDKIRELKGDKTDVKEEAKTEEEPPKVKEEKEKKKVIAPVSFSIKKPKEDAAKEIKSALPLEESDEEEVETTPANPPVEEPPPEEPKPDSDSNGIDTDDPILEMIDLTFEGEDKKDAKRAEDRVKDKIALAAREKVAFANRDKALQMERKKKAALFLKLKSAQGDDERDGSRERSEPRSKKHRDDRDRKRRSRSRDRHKDRSKSRERHKDRSKSRERHKDRSKSRDSREEKRRKDRSKSRERRNERSKSKDRRNERSKSKDRNKDRSKSRDAYKERSKSKDRRTERSKSRDRRKEKSKSRDIHTERSKSRDRHNARSKSRDRHNERSKSRDRHNERSKSRDRHRERSKSEDRDKERSRSKDKNDKKERSRGRSPKDLSIIIEENEDSDDKKRRKSVKKKKSHKRKRSKSKSTPRKKVKRKHKRSSSEESSS